MLRNTIRAVFADSAAPARAKLARSLAKQTVAKSHHNASQAAVSFVALILREAGSTSLSQLDGAASRYTRSESNKEPSS